MTKIKLPFAHKNEWRWRWLYIGNESKGGDVLHRVKSYKLKDEDYGAAVRDAVAVCGLRRKLLHMPGVFSRMGAPRCETCCEKLGIPTGNGAPFNVKISEPTTL